MDSEVDIFNRRVLIASIFIILSMAIIIFRSYDLQIVNFEKYQKKALGNSLKLAPIIPSRGKIFDRNGILLASNKLAYKLTLTKENTKDIKLALQILLDDKFITQKDLIRFNKKSKRFKKFQPITIKANIKANEVARFLVNNSIAGVELEPYFYRTYPDGIINAHILGYVAKMSVADKKQYSEDNYHGTIRVGKIGIEKQYEHILHGTRGVKQIERNSAGRVINETILRDSVPGKDIYLSIDSNLQKVAFKALNGKRGSIVVMNAQNGQIIVMMSTPSYDNNLFVNGISQKEYDKLNKNKNLPLFNRSIKGAYPPGSTIKPMIALAGLETKTIHKHSKVFCPGHYFLPNYSRKFNDWNRNGHGSVDTTDAIAQSCDVFFYDLAHKMGINKISENLQYFSIGEKTGIDLPGENAGILPSKEWKLNNKKQPWYKGETLITGIGQGFMTTTPLQLALATSMVANYGKKFTPSLLMDNTKNTFIQMPIKNIDNWELVIKGMKKTIFDAKGTARRLNKKLIYTMAGKTGTAQVFGLDPEEKYIAEKYAEHLRDHALFVGFAPIKNPEIAISIIVENAGSGSSQAAPLAKKIFNAYFSKKF